MDFLFIKTTIVFLYLSKFSLQFKPFKMSFGDIANGLGWLFISFAILCFKYSGYKKALQDTKFEYHNKVKD